MIGDSKELGLWPRRVGTAFVYGLIVGGGIAQAATPTDAGATADTLEEVTVTGSRVISNGNDSPTPVTVLSVQELLQANPGNVAEAMQMLPSLIGNPTQGGQSGTNFQNVLNLRGMGGARNLVMFDGHRLQSTTVLGGIQTGVDSNLIPTMLLKRVDIVTGGASAVYGSDAVSGVINYIVDNNFNGVSVNAQQSMSTYGDDRAFNLGIAAGTALFDGRGHVEFSAQRIKDPGLDRYARAWGREVWSMQGSVPGSTAAAGSAANPYAMFENARFNVTTFGGLIDNGALAGQQFTGSGTLAPFVHGIKTGSSTVESGGDGAYYTTYPALGAQTQDLGLGRFDFSFTDKTKGYFEIAVGSSYNYNPLANAEIRTKLVGYNNAFLSTVQAPYQSTIAAQVAANPNSSFQFSRIFLPDQVAPPLNEARGLQWLYLTGLEGSVGDYKWDVGYEHADAGLKDSDPSNISNPRLYAAMNAVVNPTNNQIVCSAALANPSVYGSCVPMDIFGQVSPAAQAYIQQFTYYQVSYALDDATASLSGAPISSWAGPINMALSAEWRRQTYKIDSNAASTDPVVCTGIQFNCSTSGTTATTPYLYAVTNPFPKSTVRVSEASYETEVPLLKGAFLAKSLAFNGAVRFTDYSSSGSVWTWKLGLTWALNDSWNVRATRSRDIRAPNQQNLYAPYSCNVISFTDIHTNNTPGNVQSCSVGNPTLQPEKADTWTLGVVWTPTFLDGFSMSLDGYHINLTDAINTTSATQPATQTVCENSGGTSPVCAGYIRPFPYSNTSSLNFPTQVINLTLNTGGIFTDGIDGEMDYQRMIAGRKFSSRVLLNWQPELTYDLGPAGIYYIGGAADGIAGLIQTPNFKGIAQFNYELFSHFTVTLQERYRNALKQHGFQQLYFAMGKQPPTEYTDVNLDYKLMPGMGGDLDLFFNVKNLLNKQPDPWASSGANAQVGSLGGYMLGDDNLGRYFTAGLRYKF